MRKLTKIPPDASPYLRRTLQGLLGKDLLSLYKNTPLKLRRALSGLGERQLATPPAKGKWSIRQIIAHISDAEVALGYRIRKVIAEPGSRLQAYDQDRWAVRLHHGEIPVRAQLELLAALQRVHGELFRRLNPSELKRHGMHEERGKETVERMIHMLIGHGINHLKQVEAIRKKLLAK